MKRTQMLLGAGWKMNKTVREAQAYARRLVELLDRGERMDEFQLFVIPPFTAIEAVKRASAGRFWVGAQNMHWEECGAFTGEISAAMLRDLGTDLVELGHAERRRYFNETDQTVRLKVDRALQNSLRPLICVGEQLQEREAGLEKEAVTQQLSIALGGVPAELASRVIVAYEPVWAIGAEVAAASLADVRAMSAHIRLLLDELFGAEAAAVSLLYGGAVDANNCVELAADGGVDGLFIGRAAWTPEGFARIIASCAAALHNPPLAEVSESRPC